MSCCTGKYDILAGTIAAFGGLTSGIVLGYSSPSIAPLQKEGLLNQTDVPWFTSIAMIGALLGSLISGYTMDTCGRKGILIFTSLPAVIGWSLICAAESVTLLQIGRFLTGIAAALYQSGCVYVIEIAAKNRRGSMSSLLGLFANTGILVVYVFGSLLTWRWITVASSVVVVVHLLLVIPLPESPRWYILHNRTQEAFETLVWLRGNIGRDEIRREFSDIVEAVDLGRKQAGWISLLDRKLYKQILLSFLLMCLNQTCGKYAVAAYQNQVFTDAGFRNPNLPSMAVAAVCVFGSAFSTVVVDRIGRKPLYVTGGIILSSSCFILGISLYLKKTDNQLMQLLALSSLIVYNFGFAITWSAVAILLVAEIFPLKYRGIGTGFGMGVFWLSAFCMTSIFPPLERLISSYGMFWMFSGISLIGTLIVCSIMPETKGKSLEEVQAIHFDRTQNKNYSSLS